MNAIASRFSIEAVFSAVDAMTAPMNKMSAGVNKFTKTGQKQMSGFGRATSTAGDFMKGMIGFSLLDRGTQAIIDFAQNGIKLASDLTEVQNVVDTTFGGNSDKINKWAKDAGKSFGISELEAKQFNATLGAMMKSSGVSSDELVGMSTTLSGLAGDMASFYNLDTKAAFDKIRSGISGETEPLKQLGINMSVANLEAYNLSKGITKSWKDMTQAEQVQTRYNFLMKASADAQGDFAKTLDTSVANQARVAQMQKDQLSANIMMKLLPNQLALYKQINSALDFLNQHHEAIASTVKFLAGVLIFLTAKLIIYKAIQAGIIALQFASSIYSAVSGFIELSGVIGPAIKQMGLFKFLLGDTIIAQRLLTVSSVAWGIAQKAINLLLWLCPIMMVVGAIGLLAYAIYDLYTNWNSYALQFNISIQNFVTGFARAKMEVYELLYALGMVSDKELSMAKMDFLQNFTTGVKMQTEQIKQRKASGESIDSIRASMGMNSAPITQRDSINQSITQNTSENNLNIRNDSKNNVDLNGQSIPQGHKRKLAPSGGF